MSVRIRCQEPAELLPLVPYLLGFTPDSSLVMLTVTTGRIAPHRPRRPPAR